MGLYAPAKDKPLTLLTRGNPQMAKAAGGDAVQASVEALPGRKGDIGRRLGVLIVYNVPNVREAVRWDSPLYGIEG